jgi:hypothetical protein
MYIAVASIWLRVVDGVALTRWYVTGAVIALVGMAVIALQPAGVRGRFGICGGSYDRQKPARSGRRAFFTLADIHGRIGVVVRPLRE